MWERETGDAPDREGGCLWLPEGGERDAWVGYWVGAIWPHTGRARECACEFQGQSEWNQDWNDIAVGEINQDEYPAD